MQGTAIRSLQDISDLVRRRRREMGLSQKEFADRAGVETKQISRIETGANEPKASTLLAIIAALGLDLRAVERQKDTTDDLGIEDIF